MAFEVEDPQIPLKPENKFFFGSLYEIIPEEGKFGPQLKWVIHLDGDTYMDDDGVEQKSETWTWCSSKLTTNERNKFRKYVKGLTGQEPQIGELFEEEHYTVKFYENNPEADPEALTGKKEPWRVAVMFEHYTKSDGSPGDKVSLLIGEDQTR